MIDDKKGFFDGLNWFYNSGQLFSIVLIFVLIAIVGSIGWVVGSFDRNCELELNGKLDLNLSYTSNPILDSNKMELNHFKIVGPCAPMYYFIFGLAQNNPASDEYLGKDYQNEYQSKLILVENNV